MVKHVINTYAVRDLVNAPLAVIEALPSPHVIEFEDGTTLECRLNQTIYTHFFWRLIREYPKTKITKDHHVTAAIGKGSFNSGTHRKLLSSLFRSIIFENNLLSGQSKEHMLAVAWEVLSEVAWVIPRNHAKNAVISIDAIDFVMTANHPAILEIRDRAKAGNINIQTAYNEIMKTIHSVPELQRTGLGKAIRYGMVSENQVLQCIGFRGVATEVDGAIFPETIWTNYTEGHSNLRDLICDSRLASKSYYYSEAPLQDSEYQSRQFHFFVTTVQDIHLGDCGTKRLLPWLVRGPQLDAFDTTIYKGDLTFMKGAYYKLSPDDKNLYVIRGDEDHLIGKTIYLRNVINCECKDPHGVCSTCVGELSHNISRFMNLGFLSSTSLTAVLSQNILSIKHVNTSSTMLQITLDAEARTVLHSGSTAAAIYVKPSLQKKQTKMLVGREEAQGLVDLLAVTDSADINPSRISSITQIRIQTTDKGRHSSTVVNVSQRGTGVLLSKSFLCYLKEVGWKTTANELFEFDLEKWDYEEPILEQPAREYSYVDLSRSVSASIKSKQSDLRRRQESDSPSKLLTELFDQVNSKLNVNILCLSVIVRGVMTASKTSYELAYGVKAPVLGLVERLNKVRSLGPAMAFQSQGVTLMDPSTYFQGYRPDSIFDVSLCPADVVKHYKKNHEHMDAGLATTRKDRFHLIGKTSSSGLF